LPALIDAGISCSLSTDDPAMFETDVSAEYAAAATLGVEPRTLYDAGVKGALCDEPTRSRLRAIGDAWAW
jgi:aminodeoxyfutalosine deaminase